MKRTFKAFVSFVLLLTTLTILVACGPANQVKLDAGDDGSQVELQVGQKLVVSLEGNPTTGYTWEAADLDEKVLRQVGEAEFKADSGATGAGGTQTLRFEAVNSGQTTLKLAYLRPWEDAAPEKTFSVQVVVR